MNENQYFRNVGIAKTKKNFQFYNDHVILDRDIPRTNHIHSESVPYKYFNGGIRNKNQPTSIDRNPLLNYTSNDYSNHIEDDSKTSQKLKELSNNTTDQYKSQDYHCSRYQYDTHRSIPFQKDKPKMTKKFTFLQESQLNSDKCDCASDSSKETCATTNSSSLNGVKTTSNGLNPAAAEFTPSSVSSTKQESSKFPRKVVKSIENGFKTLSLGTDNVMQTISNPIVIESSELNYTNPQLSLFTVEPHHLGKLGFVDPQSLVHSVYQYHPSSVGGSIARVNYPTTPQLLPQFQVALYGTQPPHLIPRYNSTSHNIPVNIHGGYLVYNPVIINGLYNQCIAATPVLTATNRLVPFGTAETNLTTHNIAHPFNASVSVAPYPSYYTDSINNSISHIR